VNAGIYRHLRFLQLLLGLKLSPKSMK